MWRTELSSCKYLLIFICVDSQYVFGKWICFVSCSKYPNNSSEIQFGTDFLFSSKWEESGKSCILMTFYINVASVFWNWLACFTKPTRECTCHFPCTPLGSQYLTCRLTSVLVSWQRLSVTCLSLSAAGPLSLDQEVRPDNLWSPLLSCHHILCLFFCGSNQNQTWAVAVTQKFRCLSLQLF